jgi:Arc/MetJ family transcription regulator
MYYQYIIFIDFWHIYKEGLMPRTTLEIDDGLLREAKRVSGIKTTKKVVDEGLRMIVRQSKLKHAALQRGSRLSELTQDELELLRTNG